MLPFYQEVRLPALRRAQDTASLPQVFASFLGEPHAVLLDSSLAHPHMGRYSYFAADPFLVLQAKGNRIRLTQGSQVKELCGDPFAVLEGLLRRFPTEPIPGLPPFQGGAVGYLGYELGRHLEELPRTTVDDVGLWDLYLGFYDWVVAQEHSSGRTWVVVTPMPDGDYRRAERRLAEVSHRLELASGHPHPNPLPEGEGAPQTAISSNFTQEGYLEAVRRAREYIIAGDIYQVCLSQRLEVETEIDPWTLYRQLRQVSPVPYGAFLNFEGAAFLCASPELFLRVEDGRIETRPIKGTRPRGKTPEQDECLARELRESIKDRAENLMIVDLLRNDLGKVSRLGTVRVPDLFAVEAYSTVYQLVSTVTGELAEGKGLVDLLRACFPGGSVTGCPKKRAMEIIDELEPTERGAYCGAMGYLGFNGNLDTNIVIRTIVRAQGRAYFQVGGAIVYDSDPEGEYQETLDKAKASLLALGLA